MKFYIQQLLKNKHIISILCFLTIFFVSTICCAQNLLDKPQKIIIDKERNRYLVSNFRGGGDLVQIDSLGNQSYFVENAGMIDALQIIGNTIYGTSYPPRIKGYDLNSGLPVMNLSLAGATSSYITGLAADSAGYLYGSERLGNRVFKIDPVNETYWFYTTSSQMDQPNGMLYEKDKNRILVCLDKPDPPMVIAINLEDSSVSTVLNETLGGSDGIARDGNGNYYISGYYLDGIYKYDPDFSQPPELFFPGTFMVYPTYNDEHNSLLITLYQQDDWLEIELGPSFVPTAEISKDFALSNNYPNPFNPSTKIIYRIPERRFVSLKVYDVLGKEIATLVNEEKPAGNYEVNFDGEQLTSGIYFYQLKAGSYSEAKKMLLVK